MTVVSPTIQAMKDHGYATLTDTQLLSALSDANIEFGTADSWPHLLLQNTQTVDGTVTPTDVLVANAIQATGQIVKVIDTTNGITLAPMRLDDIGDDPTLLTQSSVYALGYYVDAGRVYRLGNKITSRIDYKVWSYVVPGAFGTTGDSWNIPAQATPAVLALALSKCAAMEDDIAMANYWEQLYLRRLARIRDSLLTTNFDRPDRIVDIMYDDIQFY